MAQEVIRKHYEGLLVKKVRSAGRECNGIEDVLDNMDVLAKEQVKYGDEKTLWLDLTTKKMIARSIDPNCRIEIPTNEIIRYKDTLAVTAYFYWSDCDTYVGRGFARKSINDLVLGQADASRIETEFEALVIGSAITRAMTDAGIGIELYADGFEELFEVIEAQDAEKVLDRKHEEISKAIPNVTPIAEKKTSARKKSEAKKPDNQMTLEEITLPIEESVSQEEKEIAHSITQADASTLSLDEAKLVIADAGQFANQPLGLIYASRPLGIIWLYNNSATCKEAAKVIIDSDEQLSKRISK